MADIIDRLNYYKAINEKTYDDFSREIGVSRRSLFRWLKRQVSLSKISRKHRQRLYRYWRGLPESEAIGIEHTIKTFEKIYGLKELDYSVWTHPDCLKCERFPRSCRGTKRTLIFFHCDDFKEKDKNEP